ncbi:ABC transporter substrate-binding protein [Iamia majanohamensis]|uniref:ABC transporter substrate-binding protein n=1 Tax=Iamia majanohamensis TaxID=467976 RepID=A0AAE9YA95_9ACTN|nr:ABC transporter substrate-binding protein [Iamia majanohamensis]WCO65297.1 ABC transporter substrate-binding protein [Iamia majanohamensis]
MLPSSDEPTPARNRQLRRWGPLAALAVVAIVVVAVVVATGGGDDDGGGDEETAAASAELPEGAISWTMAEEDDLDVTFPDTCDPETGKVAIPFFFTQECFADVDDNGGATSNGVTADSIKVVVYVAPEDDPVLDYVTSAIANDDTNQDVKDTYQGYVDLFNEYYQTYGRTVEVEFLDGSGTSDDEVAARADAVKAADEMGAFAVFGGPVLTSAFADELAARGVVCVGCTGGNEEFYAERSPYLYGVGINADQLQLHLVEYITKRLAGQPAEWAGDEAMTDQERTFGLLWIESNDTSAIQAERLEERLGEEGIDLAESISYTLDPARLQEQATSVIARFKAAGVTTLIFSGDPVAPATFTQEATAQGYSPEWLIGPSTLVDVNAFARTYDQDQWAHAFGPSALTVRQSAENSASYQLYEWYNGEPPPAVDTNAVLFPNPSLFFAGVQLAGPDLTPETFQAGLFSREPTPNVVTSPSLSYGDHGLWPYDDFNGTDDATEIWYDPTVEGLDEVDNEGTGMYRYVDGGVRHLPGEWPDGPAAVFDPEGTVTTFEDPPPDESPKDYPAP